MLYDKYKNKILKLSNARDFILRHKIAFCALFCAIIALFATFLGFKGKITKQLKQDLVVTYGDEYKNGGGAFCAFMNYEYRLVGENDWSKTKPTAPGEYEVRAYAKKGYGGKNYTDVTNFTILKRDLIVEVSQTQITYGDSLSVSASLVSGDYLNLEKLEIQKSDIYNLKFTAVPTLESIEIRNENGKIVTDYYNVSVRQKTITVNKRNIALQVDGKTKEYDGEYLSCEDYRITSGKTLDGETLTLDFNDRIIDYGAIENKPSWKVVDQKGRDTSQFYNVSLDCGYLSITKRDITVKTASSAKIYDGKPLYNATYEIISSKGLINGDAIVVANSSSQTLYGETKNVLSLRIYNTWRDVTDNYNITYEYGTLRVDKKAIEITSLSSILTYNGQEQGYTEFIVSSGSLAEGDVAYVSENATLKTLGSCENKIKVRIYSQDQTETTSSYDISYKYGSIQVVKRSVTLAPKFSSKTYDGKPLICNEVNVVSGSLASGHYAEIVTDGTITTIGSCVNNIKSYKIFDYEGYEVTENYSVGLESSQLMVNKKSVTVKPDDKEKVYDGKPLYPSSFSFVGANLVEGHFLQVEYSGSQTEVGVGASYIIEYKVVDENQNDMTYCYNIYPQKGKLTVLGKDLFIKTDSAQKTYDGTPLSCNTATSEGLNAGDYFEVTYAVGVTDFRDGGYENVQIVEVYNSLGQSVTRNYNLIYDYGTLTINKKPVDVKLLNAEKDYDALPLFASNFESDGLILGHRLIVEPNDYLVSVGSKSVSIKSATVFDQYDVDKTHNYTFNFYDGILTVNKRNVTLKPTDEKKEYDGTPLTSLTAETVEGSVYELCDGHTVNITSLSKTEIGVYQNEIITYEIIDAEGKDVTLNYNVNKAYGYLEIERIKFFLRPGELRRNYDGSTSEIANDDYWVWGGSLLPGHEISLEIEVSQNGLPQKAKFVGSYDVIVTDFAILVNDNKAPIDDKIINGDNVVVLTDHYEVTIIQSVIEILPRKVYVSTQSKTVVYDENITDPTQVLVSADEESVEVDFRAVSWTETYVLPMFNNNIMVYEYLNGKTSKENRFDTSAIIFYGTDENGDKIVTTKNYEIIEDFGIISVTKY